MTDRRLPHVPLLRACLAFSAAPVRSQPASGAQAGACPSGLAKKGPGCLSGQAQTGPLGQPLIAIGTPLVVDAIEDLDGF